MVMEPPCLTIGKFNNKPSKWPPKPVWIRKSPQPQRKNDLNNCKEKRCSPMPSAMNYSLCKWLHFGKAIHHPKVDTIVTNGETRKMGAAKINVAVHEADTENNQDHAQEHALSHVPNPIHAPVPAPNPVLYPALLHVLVTLRKVPLQVHNPLTRAVIEKEKWSLHNQKTGVCTDQEGAHEKETTKILIHPMHNIR